MSDSNRTRIGYVKEVTAGTTPASPAFKNFRVKTPGLSFAPKTKESQELRFDRRIADIIRVQNEIGGTLGYEVSWGALDDFMEAALQSAWSRNGVRNNNGTAASIITSVAGSGVYNFSAGGATDLTSGSFVIGQLVRATGFGLAANNGLMRVTTGGGTTFTASAQATSVEASPAAAARLKVIGFRGVAGDVTAGATGLASTVLDFTTLTLVQGQWIKVGGSAVGEQYATAANNGWARINGTITATALPLDNLPVGWSVDAGAAKTITVQVGDVLKDAAIEQSFSIEQQYLDLAVPEYDVFSGMAIDTLPLQFRSNDILMGSVSFIGFNATNSTTRTAGATDVAAPTNDVINAASNVGTVTEGGTAFTGTAAATSLDLSISNSLRRRVALGSLGAVDIASGSFRCKGKLSLYYASNAVRTKILAGTASSFYTRTVDTTAPNGSRAYIVDLPRIKYESGNPDISGLDTDRTISPDFSAIAHATLGYSVSIQRMEEYF